MKPNNTISSFLETLTWLGNDVLIPINRIKHITRTASGDGWMIKIATDDGDLEECYKDFDLVTKRYMEIKRLLECE